ncbi:MAG TPA: SRPBCC domain-containing protein [Conexibacter sp.]|jgi:uncharacterized protein YndB with AHSA1/START domain
MSSELTARAEVVVAATPEAAFRLFTDEIGLWWRTGTMYWNDAERALVLRLEPGVGGRLLEVYDLDTGEGFESGRVTAWEPGRRLALTWTQLGWADGLSTDLNVTFEPVGDGTRVRVEHSGFERVPDGEALSGGYGHGWVELLGWFTEHAVAAGGAA